MDASLTIDGYRFDVRILNDPAYGPDAQTPATFSALTGVGLRCAWRREGPPVTAATDLTTGSDGTVRSAGSRHAPLPTGASGVREGGIPAGAVIANVTAKVICGMRDDSGDHGVAASFQVRKASSIYVGERLTLAAWRG
jgi:hypothetical protein